MRLNPDCLDNRPWLKDRLLSKWHLTRSYETMELAEKNKELKMKQYNILVNESPRWEFEIRINEKWPTK